MTVLLGTVWSSIKQIEAPYVFDWENAIALDTMRGNRASSRSEGKDSCVFSSCGKHLGYILELWRRCPFETGVCSVKSGHLPRYEEHVRNVNYAWQLNSDASLSYLISQQDFSQLTPLTSNTPFADFQDILTVS